LAPEDRCHLNGLALLHGRPKTVTALGTTDEPGAWRANKATGGVLMDVDSCEIVYRDMSMPHSPRFHDGRLWLWMPVFIDGGAGNDYIVAGPGNDKATGGDGDDLILGGSGNDTIKGGDGDDGRDNLKGDKGEDIVMGDVVTLDNDALGEVHAVWTSIADYTARVETLRDGLLQPNATVLPDDDEDTLRGGSGRDVFSARLAGTGEDSVMDKENDEEMFGFDLESTDGRPPRPLPRPTLPAGG
jgi:Ca2+-binding RTX toxin-like protein